MKKSILKIQGVQELNKESQRVIMGGCAQGTGCPSGTGICYYKPGCYTCVNCNQNCPNGTQPICF